MVVGGLLETDHNLNLQLLENGLSEALVAQFAIKDPAEIALSLKA